MVSILKLESLNHEQLRELARVRQVPLPAGRLSKPTLIKALRQAALERKAARKRRQ
jgi:hypothetical protein